MSPTMLLLALACLLPAPPAPAQQAVATPVPAAREAPADDALLEGALALARLDHPLLDADAVRSTIAELAAAWTRRVAGRADPAVRAEAFAHVLFDVARLEAVPTQDSLQTLHLDSVLASRRGYCLSLSVVALAVARHLHEPLAAVCLPNHVFVRWDDGATRIDLELTRRGAVLSPLESAALAGPGDRPGSLYGRPLDTDQVLALLRHNRGFVALVEGRLDEALPDLSEAARALPGLAEVHRNLGVLHAEQGRPEEAVRCLKRALQRLPGDPDTLVNLVLARRAAGDHQGAAADLRTLRLLRPEHPRLAELQRGEGPARRDPSHRPGLRGRYYRGPDFQQLVHQRIDHDLSFDWSRRPAPGVPSDGFSVRWEGFLQAPRDGFYTFYVVANDGVRVQVDDTLVVDHWRDAGNSSWTLTGDIHLASGPRPLVVETYDLRGQARLFLRISVAGDAYPLDLPGHLFHAP